MNGINMSHRKRVKHFEAIVCYHELTFSCYQRRPLLTNDRWLEMLGEAVSLATSRHRYNLTAFVWMPEHVHLLVLPHNLECRISGLLNAIKRPFSFRIKKLLETSNTQLLKSLTIHQRPGIQTFRFWQEGPGYDRNIESNKGIRSVIDYIHMNPVRRGLCLKADDWKWSSARYYSDRRFEDVVGWPHIDGLIEDVSG